MSEFTDDPSDTVIRMRSCNIDYVIISNQSSSNFSERIYVFTCDPDLKGRVRFELLSSKLVTASVIMCSK